jgi:surface polysaccharide O-acyltransferase-like enzyme
MIEQIYIIKKPKFNIIFALLKIYLSFIVVNTHCFDPSINKYKNLFILNLLINNLPVPIFYIISFYFCFNLFKSRNLDKIKLRFERLLIPYFLWPIIIWILNNIFSLFLKFDLINSFNDLFEQILMGHCFMTVLWFQHDLIFCTILLLIIELIFFNYTEYILINLEFSAFYFQYSNYNFELFSNYNFNKKYTYGRIAEIIPYCITGYIFASSNIINFFKQNKAKSTNFIILILILFKKFDLFIDVNGFYYQGLKLYILSSVIFIFFSLIPSNKIENKFIISFIKIFSRHISGIYYIHILIMKYFENYISLIKSKTLFGSIIVYIICYCICFLGNIKFGNTKLRHLFI